MPRAESYDFFAASSEKFADRILGFILTVDGANPALFWWAENIIRDYLINERSPIIIAATKSDNPDAWSPDDPRILLQIPDDIPVVPCIATDKESCKNVLLTLLYKALEEIEAAETDQGESG